MLRVGFLERLAMKKETLRQKVTLRAKPIEVYEAFVDAKKHSAFTGSKAMGEGKVGSKFTAWDGYLWQVTRVGRRKKDSSGMGHI
jgi:activator of HSP90 ATPase